MYYYPTLAWKTAAFVTCGALRKWGNARPCSKSRKKGGNATPCSKNWKKNLTSAPVIVWKNKEPSTFTERLWNAVITSRHKMEMKYSDRGTLVQRQRYPLPSRSPQYWPMNHCVRNTTSRRSVFEKLRNSKIIFLIIASLKSGMENSIIQESNAEADRIMLLFFFSCHLFPYLHKSCLISWQNLFM